MVTSFIHADSATEAYLHAFFCRRIYQTLAVREALLADFRFIEEHSLTDGMAVFAPVDKLQTSLPRSELFPIGPSVRKKGGIDNVIFREYPQVWRDVSHLQGMRERSPR